MSTQPLPDNHPNKTEQQPARRPGRPQAFTDRALLDKGVDRFVHHRDIIKPGMTVKDLADALKVPSTTLRERFGRRRTDSIPLAFIGPAGTGGRHRSDTVARYFNRLTRHVLTTDSPALADPTNPDRQRFLRAVGAAYDGLADSQARTVLQRLSHLSERDRLRHLDVLTRDLGHVPDDVDRAYIAFGILAAARTLLPYEDSPGPLLRVELDAIDAFAAAASGPSWTRRYTPRYSTCLPALEHDDVLLTTAALRAEARVRHGVTLDAVRAAARAGRPAVNDLRTRGKDWEVTINLAIARGLAERGDVSTALSLLPGDVDRSGLLLTTLTILWHAAIATGTTAVHASISSRIQRWEARWTDPATGRLREEAGDSPEIDDLSLDEALALGADGDERLDRLSTLCAEQFTSANWRAGATVWTLPQTVEVVVHELRVTGRHAAADQLTHDLFATLGWTTRAAEHVRTRTQSTNPLPELEKVPLPDQCACQRLQMLLRDPLPLVTDPNPDLAVIRAPIDPLIYSTRRIRHLTPPAATDKRDVGPARALSEDPEQLLDALVRGDVTLSSREVDGLRKIGWLLDLRAGV